MEVSQSPESLDDTARVASERVAALVAFALEARRRCEERADQLRLLRDRTAAAQEFAANAREWLNGNR